MAFVSFVDAKMKCILTDPLILLPFVEGSSSYPGLLPEFTIEYNWIPFIKYQ